MAIRRRLTGLTVGLAAGISVAVSLASTAAGYFYSSHHFQTMLEMSRATAIADGELIRAALEHQMMENDRTLVGRMVEVFGRQPRIERVLIFDRQGALRYAAPPAAEPGSGESALTSPTCQACHQFPAAQRMSSRVIEDRGGEVLRTVIPIPNAPRCHACHDPSHRMNGVLVLDKDVGEVRAALNSDVRWMAAGAALFTLALVGAVGGVVRVVVLRRLQRFETTARRIAAGDLDRRVPVTGSDTISWLGSEFNAMADAVTGLVKEVGEQRERLETIINSIDDGIAVLDADRRIVAANDAFVRRAGRPREEVVGRGCAHAGGGTCGAGDCPANACLRSGERQVRICERRSLDGSVTWEEIHTSPIRDTNGAVPYVVEVWRDISERRAAEARLAESHRLASLGLLASGFSHELNTPLGTVLMCVEGILRDLAAGTGTDRVAENASIAREQVLRCRGVTQNFLRFARGRPSPGDIVDVSQAVDVAVRLVSPSARAANVTIDVLPAKPGLLVRADEAELEHALINIVLNAVQACRAGGRVLVGAEGGDPVRIRVQDNGCGIPPEFHRRIFEPFVGLREGGTGLGLFMSLNFVRKWGGEIAVANAQGGGAVFDITLPALAAGAADSFHSDSDVRRRAVRSGPGAR
ncbi:MAG: PAS domain-containing sensor histidine kinase [Vicinamibacterales bacterium]